MSKLPQLETLLEELDESLDIDGFLGLYEILWTCRSLAPETEEPSLIPICVAAVGEMTTRRQLRLAWLPWPPDLTLAVWAAPDVGLDFRLADPEDVSRPFLALIDESVAAR